MSIFSSNQTNSGTNVRASEINFENKSFLVVDDITGMRTSMRITISTFGGVRIDMANTANDAIYKIERKPYDIILCDFDLGPGKDGQQLLEEIKRRKLISNSVIFMMVTAEQRYEKVVSAVEMVPDDYLIKPFTGETLRVRLTRLVHKKIFFEPIYAQMDKQEYRNAISLCDELLSAHNQHMVDLIRLKGEIFMLLGEFQQARTMYEKILAIRDIPWAKMGLAKALFKQDNFEEAADLFLKVTEESPNYMDAYDWLAKSYTALGDDEAAQQVLMKVTAKSPRILPRQKALGDVAYSNGDLDKALESYGAVLEFGQHSSFTAPEDFANVSRIHMDKGNFDKALSTMKAARKNFKDSPESALHAAVMETLIYQKSGDTAAAEIAYETAKSLFEVTGKNSDQVALDIANASFVQGDNKLGEQIIQNIVMNNHDNKKVLKQTENMFKKIGMEDKGQNLIKNSSREVIALNNRAVKLAQTGALREAVNLLTKAVTEFQANNFITLNAAHAILVCMQKEGWNDELAATAQKYLHAVKSRDPDSQKLLTLTELFKDIAKKYGIKL